MDNKVKNKVLIIKPTSADLDGFTITVWPWESCFIFVHQSSSIKWVIIIPTSEVIVRMIHEWFLAQHSYYASNCLNFVGYYITTNTVHAIKLTIWLPVHPLYRATPKQAGSLSVCSLDVTWTDLLVVTLLISVLSRVWSNHDLKGWS